LASSDRLPGIFVEPVAPAGRSVLPPMDIAGFAGFAERGPCNRAIAIDSVAAFEACFGGEALLARRGEGDRWSRAALAATVSAFFANGGRRCWVVRLARTPASEAAWAAATGRSPGNSGVARAGLFPLDGILWRVPGPAGGSSRVRAARLQASSLGSWSDSLRLAARVTERPVLLNGPAALPGGFRAPDPGALPPGTLVELVGQEGAERRFAKVLRRDGADLLFLWCSSFLRTSASNDFDAEPGKVRIPGVTKVFDGTLFEGADTRIEFAAGPPAEVSPGGWLHFVAQGEAVWMLVARVTETAVHGPAWQQVASRLPAGSFWARSIGVDLAATVGERRQVFTELQPGAAGTDLLDDDGFYAAAASRRAVRRAPFALSDEDRATFAAAYAAAGSGADFASLAASYGTPAFTPAARRVLRSAWLPLGLTGEFGPARAAYPSARPALERDGLSRFDAELFLDPSLAAVDAAGMAGAIEQRRDIEEAALIGIHALADTPDTAFGLPSLVAVPDILHPSWTLAPPAGLPGKPEPGGIERSDWLNHAGGCPPDDEMAAAASPRFDRFLDCRTRRLAKPELRRLSGKAGAGDFVLGFATTETDVEFILEESGDAGFLGSTEIYRGTATEFPVSGRPEGAHYFRLRIESDGNSSEWAALGLRVQASDYFAAAPDPALLRQVHIATLRLAAGTGDMVALLGLPEDWRTGEASEFARDLRTLAAGYGGAQRLGRNERRALSYGALFHPWLVYRTDRDRNGGDGGLASSPPLGCVAGTLADTARRRGAWIAHANRALTDVIGLAPALPHSSSLPLQLARVNLVRAMPLGFMLQDNDTLSDEVEWKEITVRRLMILLRRIALEQGNTYVFEPSGPVMRRAVENHFGRLLDDLQRRGAFAGANSSQSFSLQVDNRPEEAERGRFVVEIGVAPSVPMRFLTLRLLQEGGRLTLAEEAA